MRLASASTGGLDSPEGAAARRRPESFVQVTRSAAKRATRLRGFQDAIAAGIMLREAIEAGVDPSALVESINQAQAERAAARAEVNALSPAPSLLSDTEVYAMIDAVGDIGRAPKRANSSRLRARSRRCGWLRW